MIKQCMICHNSFNAKRKTIKCCSDKCRKQAKINYDTQKLELICIVCHKVFYASRKTAKVCSPECAKEHRKKTLICVECGNKYLGRKDSKFCSQKCITNNIKKRDLIYTTCDYCGKTFQHSKLYPSRFCSKSCDNKYYVEKNYSTLNKYGTDWYRLRKETLDYYGYECIRCGAKQNINIHHTIPRMFFNNSNIDTNKSNNFEYLIPLCKECHLLAHRELKNWFKDNYNNLQDLII